MMGKGNIARSASRRIHSFGISAIILVVLAMIVCIPSVCIGNPIPEFDHKAELENPVLPAVGRQETVLTVSRCGRYAVTVKSGQGTAIQLIDKMAGPGEVFGYQGREDGRIDAILDRGEYKIVSYSHEKGEGEAVLKPHTFKELNAPKPPRLVEFKTVVTVLGDFQQRSYWLEIKDRRYVAIEAAGRNLEDLRIWKDGSWLTEDTPKGNEIESETGKPLGVRRLVARLDKGLYLLTAYGGPSRKWAETSDEHPLYIRFGIPELPAADRRRFTASPFGIDRWIVPKEVNYYRLELEEAEPASIRVAGYSKESPFSEYGSTGVITKKSMPPVADFLKGSGSRPNTVIIKRRPGADYVLQYFENVDSYSFEKTGTYWLSSVHSGFGEDSADATALLVGRKTLRKRDRKFGNLIEWRTVDLDYDTGWRRRFNLLDELTLFLHVKATGKYVVEGTGAEALYRVEPFLIYQPPKYKSPRFEHGGHAWELDKGFFVLTVRPESKGILDLHIRPGSGREAKPVPARTSVRFPNLPLSSNMSYTLYLNRQPGVHSGAVLRRLPIDLTNALPVTLKAGEKLDLRMDIPEKGDVRALAVDGKPLPISINDMPPKDAHTLEKGSYQASFQNSGANSVDCSLGFKPVRLSPGTPLPELSKSAYDRIPEFPVLEADSPVFLDVVRRDEKTFRVNVAKPALYRLETTGLLETTGNLRTRTIVSFDRQSANGVGRNFLIQQYLREGDYQLTMGPRGETRGHMGLKLSGTRMNDGGMLSEGIPARYTLRGGEGLVYRFAVPEKDEYTLRAMGLNRDFRMRLEDADGWPLLEPGVTANLTREFRPGEYRLVILPEQVDCRAVTLLERVPDQVEYEGHGPHTVPVPMNAVIRHVWYEPEEGGERIPDSWRFETPAPVDAKIAISGGMIGELVSSEGNVLTRITLKKNWKGRLETGMYTLEARSLYPNNQLGYNFCILFKQMIEGERKTVKAPAEIDVSLGAAGLVEFGSYGNTDVRARLYDGAGLLLAQNDDRADDWNFHIARNLAAGMYRLRIDPVGTGSAQTNVSFARPIEVLENEIGLPGRFDVSDGDLHVWPLNIPRGDEVLLVSAQSKNNVRLFVEGGKNGAWETLAETSGANPALGFVLGKNPETKYRLKAGSADRRKADILVRITSMKPVVATEEKLTGEGVVLPRVERTNLGFLAVRLKRPGLFRIDGKAKLATARDEKISEKRGVATLVPGDVLWIAGLPGEKVRGSRVFLGGGENLQIMPDPGLRPVIELSPSKGPFVVLAESRLGMPGIAPAGLADVSAHMGVAYGSATTVCTEPASRGARVWDAAESEAPVVMEISRHDFDSPVEEKAGWGVADILFDEVKARTFELPPGMKAVRMVLPPLTVARLDAGGKCSGTHWSGLKNKTISVRTQADRLWLFNTGKSEVRANLVITPDGETKNRIDSKTAFGRHFPAAGEFRLEIRLSENEKKTGVDLNLFGPDVEAVLLQNSGHVKRGTCFSVTDGGTLDIRHGPGLVAAWLEGGEHDPWSETGRIVEIEPPARAELDGPAVTLRFGESKSPRMIRVATDTPVIAVARMGTASKRVEIFPDGANLGLYVPADAEKPEVSLFAAGSGNLAGNAEVGATNATPIREGVGPVSRLEPGGSRLFTFTLDEKRTIGLGVRGDADMAECRLLDSTGRELARGMVRMIELEKGEYLLAVCMPPEGVSTEIRPVLVGVEAPESPPPEEIQKYLRMEGLKYK